jgi:sugar/nucleoside kinase (ribokinase family)
MPQHGGDARLVRPIHTVAGGSGLNTATHLSSLLHQFWDRSDDGDTKSRRTTWNVTLQTVINEQDRYGKMISSHCKQHGFTLINRRSMMSSRYPPDNDIDGDAKSTGHCAVIVSNGDRSFMTYLGCMEDFRGSHVLAENSFHKYGDASSLIDIVHHRHVHVAGYYNIVGFWDGQLACKLAEIRGIEANTKNRSKITTISLVPQQDATEKWDGGLLTLLQYIDFLFLSEVEARKITKFQSTMTSDANDHTDFLQHVAKFAPFATSETFIIVTLQSKGAVAIYDGNIVHHQRTFPEIDNPIDPTGAGDAFAAGFLYGYLRFRDERGGEDKEAVIEGMRWGCATGTSSVMVQGASVPSRKERIERILDCIADHVNQK